jgi:L-ascorbate metabolism protein UlaG (beta-lactamase superfamily)
LASSSGFTALLDPTNASTGYQIPAQEGMDVVTVSHEHGDHNNVALAKGSPLVLRGLAGSDVAKIDQEIKGARVRSVATFHDDKQGSARGKNAVFVYEVAGLRVAHLGDLGHVLSAEQVQAVGKVDVLLVPVGGFYTLDGKGAAEVVNQLAPRVVIPMHYKTADLGASLSGVLAEVGTFTAALGNTATVVEAGHTVTLEAGNLPAGRTVMVMKYK